MLIISTIGLDIYFVVFIIGQCIVRMWTMPYMQTRTRIPKFI